MSKYLSDKVDHALSLNIEEARNYINKEFVSVFDSSRIDNDLAGISEYDGITRMTFIHKRDNSFERVEFNWIDDKWTEIDYKIHIKENE